MPLLLDEMNQLSKEKELIKKGAVPPLMSLIVNLAILFISFVICVFYVLPFLVSILHLNFWFALIITIGVFVLLDVILGELVALMTKKR